jgi:hypothetical protein
MRNQREWQSAKREAGDPRFGLRTFILPGPHIERLNGKNIQHSTFNAQRRMAPAVELNVRC